MRSSLWIFECSRWEEIIIHELFSDLKIIGLKIYKYIYMEGKEFHLMGNSEQLFYGLILIHIYTKHVFSYIKVK